MTVNRDQVVILDDPSSGKGIGILCHDNFSKDPKKPVVLYARWASLSQKLADLGIVPIDISSIKTSLESLSAKINDLPDAAKFDELKDKIESIEDSIPVLPAGVDLSQISSRLTRVEEAIAALPSGLLGAIPEQIADILERLEAAEISIEAAKGSNINRWGTRYEARPPNQPGDVDGSWDEWRWVEVTETKIRFLFFYYLTLDICVALRKEADGPYEVDIPVPTVAPPIYDSETKTWSTTVGDVPFSYTTEAVARFGDFHYNPQEFMMKTVNSISRFRSIQNKVYNSAGEKIGDYGVAGTAGEAITVIHPASLLGANRIARIVFKFIPFVGPPVEHEVLIP
jgi:hypothetical protein